MPKAAHHIPTGLNAVIPQLVVEDGRKLIAFLENTFGAKVGDVMPGPDGKGVMHGFVLVEDVAVFIAEPFGQAPVTKANLMVYVRDVDATIQRAQKAGAAIVTPAADMPWGDRWGMVRDPFGNVWQVATHIEDVPPDEMKRRMAAAQKQ